MVDLSQYRTFITEVVDVAEVHPHLRRITFGGGDLATFTPAGPDTFLYVLVPPPGSSELTIDRSFSWEDYYGMPDDVRPVGAYYTLRHWDPEAQRLEMLFVLHGDEGHASAWAGRARPGDPAALWGPRTAFEPPTGTDRYLLVADETGLPAVAAIIESRPDDVPVQVLAEVSGDEWHPLLPERSSVAVTWLHRQGAEAGTTTLLGDAIAALEPLEGTPYVWGGGESRGMTAVRKVVRRGWGLSREAVSLVAYWRHAAHLGDPADDED